MNKITFIVLLIASFVNCNFANAESSIGDKSSRNVTLVVRNQQNPTLSVERILGDKKIVIDSLEIEIREEQEINSSSKKRIYTFTLTSEEPAGIYRLVLGKTLVAEVLNEPPQSIDIIINSEDVFIETDFEKPLENTIIFDSEENKLWYKFAIRKREFEKAFQLAGKEVDYCTASKNEKNACVRQIEYYNELQKQQNKLIDSLTALYPGLLATQIIKSYKLPYTDGYSDKNQRDSILKSDFFKYIDFSDELLLNTPIYSNKIYTYLLLYAKSGLTKDEQENQFILAISNIFESIRMLNSSEPKNSKVYDFVIDYLLRGFEETDMTEVVLFIGENFSTSNCQSEEKNIVDRKLEYYKMKIGDSVPDFWMKDINDDQIQLSEFLKPLNIIVFWSSECPHCKEMLPKLSAWYKSINKVDFEIFAVSLDTDHAKWEKTVSEFQMESWLNLSDLASWDGITALQYNVFKTPTIFFVDEERTIISKPGTVSEIINEYSNQTEKNNMLGH